MLHHTHVATAFCFGTRQGKLLILSAISLICLSLFLTSPNEEDEIQKPVTQKTDPWEEDYSNPDTVRRKPKKYESFVPFVPKPPKSEVVRVEKPEPAEKPVKIPKPTIPIQQQAPLIKMLRRPSKIVSKEEVPKAVQLPSLELGATLHCQLSTPATTDNPNAPVIAVVTRSLIRDGITIIPRGSKLFGKVQSSSNNRIFFAQDWTLRTSRGGQRSISGNAQEKGYDAFTHELLASDGRLGLPGTIENKAKPKKLGAKILDTAAKAAAQFGKETVRTTAGEFVPATGRNAAIAGSSAIIDQVFAGNEQTATKPKPYVHVPVGQEFYLMVTTTGEQRRSQNKEPSIDQLLHEAMKQRLQE